MLHEAMEISFNLGATPSQYAGYINKSDFKKKLTSDEWESIAPYFYACNSLNSEVAVNINGFHTIPPDVVKKEMSRHISATRQALIMHQKVPGFQNPGQSFVSGRIKAYVPTTGVTREKIPDTVLGLLPIWESRNALLTMCECDAIMQKKTDLEIGNVANSGYFHFLKVLIYRLSNNILESHILDDLLDKVMNLGFRSSLKGLLSLKGISFRTVAENILPLLIIRQDEDLIRHIFEVHGFIQIKYYIAFHELSWVWQVKNSFVYTGPPYQEFISYFFHAVDDEEKIMDKYSNVLEVLQFLAKIIETKRILPASPTEAAILISLAVKWSLISAETMRSLLPYSMALGDIETEYHYRFEEAVLRSNRHFGLRALLQQGFRRSLHAITLEAVLRNDIEACSDLLPFTEVGLSNTFFEQLKRGCTCGERVWDPIGMEGFASLVDATSAEMEREAPKTKISGTKLKLSCLIFMACYLKDDDLLLFPA
ncbi:hypothetical protein AA313_de0207856 [Arthrobotrys entomopaga]|nr:hypothetical protein AA313_de0207856 [Arthrobotrys entomopaga]